MEAGNHLLFEKSKDYALDYMRTVNQRSVYPSSEALRALEVFRETPPDGPTEAGQILDMLHQFGSPATIAQTGGRYFGFVNGGAIDAALAAKWLADVWDQNAAMYVLSPIASVLESVCEEWLVDFLGLPNGTAAGFVGGTSIGTLTGLAAGRDELLRRLGWNASSRGLFDAPQIRVVLGAQTHASVFKALSLLGLGRERIIEIPSDDQGRIVPEKIGGLDDQTLLILQAGNVNSGAFDAFLPICERARKAGAWVHVDGAFGLWAAASERRKHLTEGVQLADSWSTDAHKTLNAPYNNGIIFCRDRQAITRAMQVTGSYLVQSEHRDGMLYTPEMARRTYGVEMWTTLKALGRSGVAKMVDDLCDKAVVFAEGLQSQIFLIRNQVCFNQVLVSCGAPELTRGTLANIQSSGECWCGGAIWQNEPVIRISVCSWATTRNDIDRSIEVFVKAREQAQLA